VKDLVFIFGNGLALFFMGILIALYFKYRKK
jgi:hypothetical protein